MRWILIFQEFDCPIMDKKGSEDLVDDHLYIIGCVGESKSAIYEFSPNERLFIV